MVLINEPLKVYSIQVKDTHTFFVGAHGVLTHNMMFPATTIALSMPLSIGCGGGSLGTLFGPAGVISGLVIGGVIGCIISACRKNKDSGYRSLFNVNEIQAYFKNNDIGQEKKKDAPGPEKPRNDNKYPNMYEVFGKAVIGKQLKECSKSTSFSYKGISKIYKVIKDIAKFGIKKGDWFYLDKMHGDHIEVFKKCGKVVRTVLNMDGTENKKKLVQAIGRDILPWIR